MASINIYKGIDYELPKQPPKEKIAGHDLPKSKQKWIRTELPKDFDEWELDQQEAFAYEEDRRCTEGYWLYINGVATYLTGDHYHYLNWFKIDSGYPDYRDRDRRWFYHWELCDLDEECLGQMYGKLRRDGYSYRCDSIMLNRARKTFNANYGIVSKTGDDAKEMFDKLVHGFLEYPIFFKPQVQNAEDVKKELVFKTPQQRVTFKNRATKKEIALNTKLGWKNSTENAYDGMKIKVLCADEAAKWKKDVNVEKWFNIGRTCLILGGRIIGKMLMGSTVNELDKGGEGFLNLWKKSDYTERTENGRTISGLWRYFIPSYDGMEGFIDEFGQSVIETPEKPVMGIDGRLIKVGAKRWIENELSARKKAGDSVGYYEFKRQFPMFEEDMFITPADEKTCWDIEKIYQQIEHNDIHIIDRTLHCGYFSWKDGIRDTISIWNSLPYDDPKVKHRFAWMPKPEDCNKWIFKNGKKAPANTHVGLFTIDPYKAKNTTDKRQSKAASHGFKKFDMMAEAKLSDVFIGEYWNRLSDPLLVYEDMILQCVYFGWALLPERNVTNCNDLFTGRGYDNYLMDAPSMTKEEFISKIGKNEDPGLANTSGKTQQQMVEYLASYITNNIGFNEKTGQMGYMPFNNTLKDLLEFDIDAWTKYDLTISAMLSVIGSKAITYLVKPPPKKREFFPRYNNSGMESRKIE
jgi:hypothetical protein